VKITKGIELFILQLSPSRSGSTWQFNIIREICEKQGFTTQNYFFDRYLQGESKLKTSTDCILIKSHFIPLRTVSRLFHDTGMPIFMTIRSLEEMIVSARRIGGNINQKKIEKSLKKSLILKTEIIGSGIPYHLTRISDLSSDSDSIREISLIDKALFGNKSALMNPEELAKKYSRESLRSMIYGSEKLGVSFQNLDLRTYLHGNHIAPKEFSYHLNTEISDDLRNIYEKFIKVAQKHSWNTLSEANISINAKEDILNELNNRKVMMQKFHEIKFKFKFVKK